MSKKSIQLLVGGLLAILLMQTSDAHALDLKGLSFAQPDSAAVALFEGELQSQSLDTENQLEQGTWVRAFLLFESLAWRAMNGEVPASYSGHRWDEWGFVAILGMLVDSETPPPWVPDIPQELAQLANEAKLDPPVALAQIAEMIESIAPKGER